MSNGCGCKEVYRFPHITYPYSSCICYFFVAASLLFVLFFMFFILVPVHFCNLLKKMFAQYKQTYGRLRASHRSRIKGCT